MENLFIFRLFELLSYVFFSFKAIFSVNNHTRFYEASTKEDFKLNTYRTIKMVENANTTKIYKEAHDAKYLNQFREN